MEYTEDEHNVRHGIFKGFGAIGEPIDSEKPTKKKKTSSAVQETKAQNYYDIKCKDNGCGIPADKVGDMLGRVLSGSKHGVRQTRGKFGLGAKMVTRAKFYSIVTSCTVYLSFINYYYISVYKYNLGFDLV